MRIILRKHKFRYEFGQVWTNIPLAFLKSLEIVHGNNLVVTIYHQDKKVYQNIIKFARSFADVNVGEPLVCLTRSKYWCS
ncbi:SAM hydroxide adenosyltransferase [Staphylococcus aureus]